MAEVSVVINTYNRPQKIKACLKSILQSSFQHFEVIVIEQSNVRARRVVRRLNDSRIKYFQLKRRGVGRAKNFGLLKAKGAVVAFTDDDCIVDKNWLGNIHTSFQENKGIIGLFGKVLPYRPEEHQGRICPATFLNTRKRLLDKPLPHWKYIGFGNNMAYRKKVFGALGGFKEWLGPGSIGSNAEDAEFALRALRNGYKILYNPKVVIFHDRWLTPEEFRKQRLSYSCGEVACYSYFAFQEKGFAKKIVANNFKESYWRCRKALKSLLFLKGKSLVLLYRALEELYYRFRGLMVGFYFSKKDPLFDL